MKIASLSPELLNDPEHLLRNIRGGTRAIARYLKEVVLDPLPQEVFDFLVKTSFLNRLNAGLCNGVTERDDSEAILAWIERHNLFCQPWTNKAAGFATILFCRKPCERYCSRTTISTSSTYMN
jgi:ATP/maltotriose-dependent transcriptional regulator MalT